MLSALVTRVCMFGYATNETEEYMPYAINTGTQAGTSADQST